MGWDCKDVLPEQAKLRSAHSLAQLLVASSFFKTPK